MRSVRFDPELDRQVEAAASKRGVTVSEFIREAVRRECQVIQGEPRPQQSWRDVLKGPHAEKWAVTLEEIYTLAPDDNEGGEGLTQEEAMDDWARAIYERNWRQ